MEKSTADVITCTPPSTSTFSFKAPFPTPSSSLPLKQRRVSLALPSSPRLVPAWSFRDDTGLDSHIAGTSELTPERKGKMRKLDMDQDTSDAMSEKRQRKKWTAEETQMLVDGCNTVCGTPLELSATMTDRKFYSGELVTGKPFLKIQTSNLTTALLLISKTGSFSSHCHCTASSNNSMHSFRTYFPDAYKQHYPNAKTHLSSKIRSTLPDGRSIFEKTRSKKRRPFTEDEDRALKAGYEKHGTVWATIVKDPVFQEQNRRSTDLRDRFRNAFPDLYQAAGYKPRNGPKAKRKKEDGTWIPTRAATDDQIIPITPSGPVRRRRAQTTQGYFRGGTKSVPESTTCSEDEDSSAEEEENKVFKKPAPITPASFAVADSSTPQPEDSIPSTDVFNEMDMYTIDQLPEPLSISDYPPSSSQSMSEMTDSSQLQSWAHIDPSIHSSAWSSSANTAGSPTSSHISDYFLTQSPFNRRSNGMDMIGKSAWGTQDWFSPNPRLDPSEVSSSSSSFAGGLSPAPSSPFSFQNLSHGVVDRYDLFPTTMPHDFASEVGMGDTHSTFSDPEMFAPSSFRGFTHHSNYAGDLIFGARNHQAQQPSYGSGFGFGTPGLGLQGMQQSAGIHPMQLHTPALPGIDEIELASITLNDHAEHSHHREMMGSTVDTGIQNDDDGQLYNLDSQSLDDIVDLSQELHITPPATPLTSTRSHRQMTTSQHPSSSHSRSYSVPPGEFRSNTSRPTQIHTNSQPHMARTLPHSDLAPPHHHQSSMSESGFLDQGSVPPSSYHDSWRLLSQPNNDYDLPFLDLHYYGGHASGPSYDDAEYQQESEHARQGQALDLAQSPSIKTPSSPPMGHSPLHIGHTFIDTSRVQHAHQRRQSAVSPQDLLTRKGSENKRKRASWDGGAS